MNNLYKKNNWEMDAAFDGMVGVYVVWRNSSNKIVLQHINLINNSLVLTHVSPVEVFSSTASYVYPKIAVPNSLTKDRGVFVVFYDYNTSANKYGLFAKYMEKADGTLGNLFTVSTNASSPNPTARQLHDLDVTLFDKDISKEQVVATAKELGIHEFIMSLPEDYNFNVQERGNTLSAGQKQLIAFMRVLIKNPDILILDEATSSIDSYSEDLIKSATKKITKNKTSVIIAHRLSTIEVASTIMYIEDGLILEIGNHKELMEIENGRYRKMHKEQFDNVEVLD